MEIQHDRTTSDTPWNDPKPQAPIAPNGIPDDARWEGSFAYWIEGTFPDHHIMCGGAGHIYEIQKETTWYPDFIFDQEKALLEKYERKSL